MYPGYVRLLRAKFELLKLKTQAAEPATMTSELDQ